MLCAYISTETLPKYKVKHNTNTMLLHVCLVEMNQLMKIFTNPLRSPLGAALSFYFSVIESG